MHKGIAARENNMEFLKKLKVEYHMIKQSHFWVFSQNNWNQNVEEILIFHAHCSTIHNSQVVEQT